MIAKLKGLVEGQEEGAALIDVGGVVYRTLSSAKTLAGLPAKGQPVALETEYLVIQEVPTLVGFGTLAELEAFRLLVTVNGVGPKAARPSQHLCPRRAVRRHTNGDAKAIQAAKGVGGKAAARSSPTCATRLAPSPAWSAAPAGSAPRRHRKAPSPPMPSPP